MGELGTGGSVTSLVPPLTPLRALAASLEVRGALDWGLRCACALCHAHCAMRSAQCVFMMCSPCLCVHLRATQGCLRTLVEQAGHLEAAGSLSPYAMKMLLLELGALVPSDTNIDDVLEPYVKGS